MVMRVFEAVLVFATVAGLPVCRLAADPPDGVDRRPRTIVLALGKARAVDPAAQQQRGIDAVDKVTGAVARFQPAVTVIRLVDPIMTREQLEREEVKPKVSGDIFREQLRALARTTTEDDTVIIYTHSHGAKPKPDAPKRPGGLVLNPGKPRGPTRAVLPWAEYAELILAIPARNVVVLTMSCYSGGLVDHLDSPKLKPRWTNRRKNGRNFIVLTSQNSDLMSPPIVKNRELINPFTLAVTHALAGQADGFRLVDGKPDTTGHKDRQLTTGELVDYILYTTEYTASDFQGRKNIARPQLTGSFNRREVVLTRGK